MDILFQEPFIFSLTVSEGELEALEAEAKEREMRVEDYLEACISVGRGE